MAYKFVTLFATCAVLVLVLAQQPQGGPHQDQVAPHNNQRRAPREVSENEDDNSDDFPAGANWTACDITTTPILSCHDCNTRLICKWVGGILKTCKNPWRPHCNGGICSAIPSPDCVNV